MPTFCVCFPFCLALHLLPAPVHLDNCHEGLLGNIHFAHGLHPFLSLGLLVEQFFLPADITAVALCQDILADWADGGARNDLHPDAGLDGDLEHLPWDQVLEARDQPPS